MKSLIVNGDDLGLTEGINRGIIECRRNGILTSATILPLGPAFDGAVELAKENGDLSVGVHLSLNRGSLVLKEKIGSDDFPDGFAQLLPAVALGRIGRADLVEELSAQVERVLEAGIRPTHLDGHKHVHIFPWVSEAVLEVAESFGIKKVRVPVFASFEKSVGPVSGKHWDWKRRAFFHCFGRLFETKAGARGMESPDHFIGHSFTGALSKEVLLRLLPSIPDGVSELMCHPGYHDAHLASLSSFTLSREVEMEALKDPGVRKLLEKKEIKLIGYHEF